MDRRVSRNPKTVNLALQGGGSHGAYTWGVLDALAEDTRIEISAISGASAGTMNAVVFASGMDEGGREGAREKLEKFWLSISSEESLPAFERRWVDKALSAGRITGRTAPSDSARSDRRWRPDG